MKKDLRSACLLFVVFILFIEVFAGLGSAEDEYNFSKFNNNSSTTWGKIDSPISDYKIWGYTCKSYNFSVNYNVLSPDNTTMIFYWDCSGNGSEHSSPLQLNDTNNSKQMPHVWNQTHIWNNRGVYLVAVGIFNGPVSNLSHPNISYWVPIEIKNSTDIKVDTFYMQDEKEEVGSSSKTYNVSILANSSENSDNSSNSVAGSKYCGYVKNDYSFNVVLNATFNTSTLTDEDNRTINETITEIYWGDDISDNSLSTDNKVSPPKNSNNTEIYVNISAGNFTHEWNDIGEMKINASGFFWDPLDGARYPPDRSYNNTSILIIQDPKNFVFYPLKGASFNLQNWGIILSIIGLIIFYVTYTKNNVPIEISIFGLKPFYLKSVNSFTGTLIFVAGMYLYFIFGRCPWDIPIVGGLYWLSNMYFSVLYYEYAIRHFDIPYLSILIGLLDVITLSLVIHLIAIPFYRGELKIGKFSIKKSSSIQVQPELISSPVETKINQEN